MLKKLLFIIFIGIVFLVPGCVLAQENEVNLYFFWSESCPHCAKEKEYLLEIAPNYPYLKIHDYEVGVKENTLLLQKIGNELDIETVGVPITIIGRYHFIGYGDDKTTGKVIINLIEKVAGEGDPDLVGAIVRNENDFVVTTKPQRDFTEEKKDTDVKTADISGSVKIPFLGYIDPKSLSLPILTIVLAVIDGFNPCAMWTLLFLLSLLLTMENKKRRWILGVTFIASSAFVYFLFMAAWLNLIQFIGFITWIKIVIGLVALGGGIYGIREFIVNKESGCKVTGDENRRAVFEKIKKITQHKTLIFALGGIVLLAFAVNLVELICSTALPIIFTQVLSLSNLPKWQYYIYMLSYIFIFMLDDLFIFFSAMITLEMTGISTKYARYVRLIGGILMIVIGFLLIFKPELLTFS